MYREECPVCGAIGNELCITRAGTYLDSPHRHRLMDVPAPTHAKRVRRKWEAKYDVLYAEGTPDGWFGRSVARRKAA